jgi:uridine phosphorylase
MHVNAPRILNVTHVEKEKAQQWTRWDGKRNNGRDGMESATLASVEDAMGKVELTDFGVVTKFSCFTYVNIKTGCKLSSTKSSLVRSSVT